MLSVSVIIPTYNRKNLLKRAIESVLMQEDVSLEILVCDDGSTDGTVEMVSSWLDQRVKLLPGPHGGRPAIPRNRGINAASGEWIAFLDDDDVWLPGKLHAQLTLAKEKGYKAVTTNALCRKPSEDVSIFHSQYIPECCDFKTLILINYIITSSVIVCRTLFKKVIKFPESALYTSFEDYALWLRISSKYPFGYIKEPYVIYTDNPAQSVRQFSVNEKKLKFRVYCNWLLGAGLAVFSHNGLILAMNLFKILLPKKIYTTAAGLFRKTRMAFKIA